MRFDNVFCYTPSMKIKSLILLSSIAAIPAVSNAEAMILPTPPVITVADIRSSEKPIIVETKESIVAENQFFKRVKTSFTFTNPNKRTMSGELEFPLPEGSFVCGYSLEIKGEMIPGVVCEKEKARVAFENETRKGVDPGIVENVKGNIWRTRIFPLEAQTPRRADVDYIVQKNVSEDAKDVILEKDGDDLFVARVSSEKECNSSCEETCSQFSKGTIVWDASLSAKPFAKKWRKKIESLPEKGDWALIVFRNEKTETKLKTGFQREELLREIDAIEYDGGTDIAKAIEKLGTEDFPLPALLFTDEYDTMGLDTPKYEGIKDIVIASRDTPPTRKVSVEKITKEEGDKLGVKPVEGTLLASVWAERRMQDLSSQVDLRKDEFLSLGRKYSVAGPGLSLIVLENLSQYLEHRIEPSPKLSFYNEWKKRRDAQDDPIAKRKEKAEHEKKLLTYWEERVKWWNNPIPPKKTPSSGLFEGVQQLSDTASGGGATPRRLSRRMSCRTVNNRMENHRRATPDFDASIPMVSSAVRVEARASFDESFEGKAVESGDGSSKNKSPTISLKAWDPKTPYLEAIKKSKKGEEYKTYLKEREKYASSPAFYLDCAGWFFKAGDCVTAERIITNLAEFKLEDAKLWRTMGWRLREAKRYELAEKVFRKVLKLRGEEAQSRRDLAIILMEYGKALYAAGDKNAAAPKITEAMKLFADAAFNVCARRSSVRSNDFQVSIISLEELNGLISWVESNDWGDGQKPQQVQFDDVYRRKLPVKLRIVLSWDADETDIDLHVLEPNGEEAYYAHRRTQSGGFVSEDVTSGYGPEEYLKKDLERGVYKILTNYFASHQTSLTGAATISVSVYTNWGTKEEKNELLTLRLDKPKDKNLVGEVKLD